MLPPRRRRTDPGRPGHGERAGSHTGRARGGRRQRQDRREARQAAGATPLPAAVQAARRRHHHGGSGRAAHRPGSGARQGGGAAVPGGSPRLPLGRTARAYDRRRLRPAGGTPAVRRAARVRRQGTWGAGRGDSGPSAPGRGHRGTPGGPSRGEDASALGCGAQLLVAGGGGGGEDPRGEGAVPARWSFGATARPHRHRAGARRAVARRGVS